MTDKTTTTSPLPDCCAKTSDDGASKQKTTLPTKTIRGTLLHIPSMDCSVEEAEIRRALEPVAGIRSLDFQLGARTLGIDAPQDIADVALAAIRKAGFKAEPTVLPSTTSDLAEQMTATNANQVREYYRLGTALLLAIAAESLSFFAPDTALWKMGGMAIAGIAILLAGFETYQKMMQEALEAAMFRRQAIRPCPSTNISLLRRTRILSWRRAR